ncbi:hypothetical protein [Paraburkholderia sp.]|uniref:hypothetical protein n=1 Tax=Paraburkholderia sp. TaxID=1926495 RepID=UPI003D6E7025
MSRNFQKRECAVTAEFVDLAPRWSTLMPILISAIEHGTQSGRNKALYRLCELGNTVDSEHAVHLRTRAALARLMAAWPGTTDRLSSEERAALSEASEVLALTIPNVVPIRRT